ncbi:MAG: peptidylprolyl isomerase [Taibaiella sp.]|nr:peptidylprolyl isomerase [Taibaiella sp.]
MKKLYTVAAIAILALFVNPITAQTEATFYTSMGSFKIELTDTLTPRTVDSFKARVVEGFYDGLIFHRVIDNFMIQGGDPLGNGTGGPGYTFPDEFHPTLKNVPKALAMANAGPNTNGSQFFINLVTNSHLDSLHTVFGMVTTGFNIVQNIGKVPTGTNNKPLTDVVIDSIRLTKFPVGLKNLNPTLATNVYPNPNNGLFSIDIPRGARELVITDINGRVVKQLQPGNVNTLDVDLSGQPKGVYLLRITGPKESFMGRIVLQ